MSPGAPRRRLVPQPAPPCRGPYAGVQHRRRLRASGVGCSLAPSPTAPSPSASRRAKRSRLRVSLRRHQGDACALPPGLTRDPAQTARSGTEQRPPRQSLLRPRTAAAVAAAAPPFPSVCLVCESVLSVTPVPASCVSPPRLRLSSHSEIYLSRISSEVKSHEKNVKLSPVEVSAVACRVRAAIVTGEACAASNDAQKTGHTNAVKDRRGT